ncbi:E3 ubiquitin-protein ligase RNF4-like [Callospermophilus lateralis]|uniref:E3 ubiquitin-protein ligase RNF4-like n=1 Tax=Callospermophilus lateralis TaxID=76772 RepID=UPI004038D70D
MAASKTTTAPSEVVQLRSRDSPRATERREVPAGRCYAPPVALPLARPFEGNFSLKSRDFDLLDDRKRKHRDGTVSSRQVQKRTREAASTPEISLEAEPIELVETAGDEIVDLTCESLEPVVVDLTHNDSIEIVDERRNARRLCQDHANICVVGSDDEELSRDRDVYGITHTPRNARDEGATGLRPSGTFSCPICMDGYSEMVQNGRLIVSTECGHVFCHQCLHDSLKNANTCPTCRKKINHKRNHFIYI